MKKPIFNTFYFAFLLLLTIAFNNKAIANNFLPSAFQKPTKDFGIQLWSVRDEMEKDPKATLKSLASYGYKQVETFAGSKGIFWGMTNVAFKKTLDDLGLQMISAHYREDDIAKFETVVKQAAAIGVQYVYYPWEGPDKTIADYKQLAKDLNEWGKICNKYGIKYGFHNHDYTFKKIDGIFPQDVLMQNTNAKNVFFEMDVYWVVTAGEDPIAWLKKYPNRFIASHVKDRNKTADDKELNASCVLGTGKINFKIFLQQAQKYGMKYFNVEQEKYDEGSSMECAKMNATFMKKMYKK
jgi:sugar phosphate isomerase/epimerase